MKWHRIHYTARLRGGEPVTGDIDVLADNEAATRSYSTWLAIRAQHPLIDYHAPVELEHAGKSDGSLAVNVDPRDEDPPTPFTIRVA